MSPTQGRRAFNVLDINDSFSQSFAMRFGKLLASLCLALLVWSGHSSGAQPLDARQIFEKVAPSTALIQDLDCFGSGVVLTEQGLILTNLHVVAAQLDLRVKAKVKLQGRIITADIDGVKLVKVHPKYDLALLQATPPPGGTFIPAQLLPKDLQLPTGVKCYAIGNPGGPDGKALDLSITEGLVSAASRNVENLEYVQISAALNHGNSGGPITDYYGRVFGVATWKMEDTEGIAFAIPTQKLSLSDFVAINERKEDAELLRTAEEVGKKFYLMSRAAAGVARDYYLALASDCYHLSILAAPNRVEPVYNYGLILSELGERALSKRYFEVALKIKPDSAGPCHMLGVFLIQENEANAEKVIGLWRAGITDKVDTNNAARCADDLAILMAKQSKFQTAAYMLQWSHSLVPTGLGGVQSREPLWQEIKGHIPADEFSAIRRKRSEFSIEEFDAVINGEALTKLIGLGSELIGLPANNAAMIHRPKPASPPPAPMPASEPRVKPPPIHIAELESFAKEAAEKFAQVQVDIPPDGLELPLPSKAVNPIIACGGYQVVMTFPDLGKIGVLNLVSGKFSGFIDSPDKEASYAAGGKVLVVYHPDKNLFEIYDLESLKLLKSGPSPCENPVRLLAMGLLNGSRAFVLSRPKVFNQPSTLYAPALITIPDLKLVRLEPKIEFGKYSYSETNQIRFEGSMDETGSLAAACVVNHYASTGEYTIKEDGTASIYFIGFTGGNQPRMEFSKYGSSLIGANNIFPVRDETNILANFRSQMKNGGSWHPKVTAVQGIRAFAEYHVFSRDFNGFRIRGLPAMNVLKEIPYSVGPQNDVSKVLDVAFLASAYANRLVVINSQTRKIRLFKMDLPAAVPTVSVAIAGKRFQRQLSIPKDSTVSIESGPNGLSYDQGTNSLIWNVPSDLKSDEEVQVLILAKFPDGKQDYVNERIRIQSP